MMASSLSSPEPLKGKISQVKCLLDNANKRLQENYQIFTTNTSASGTSSMQMDNEQNVTLGLKRTMNDISTLRSVLNCPIFNRIVDVTDSLDKLSYQLNMHPSIGPSDYNIDVNGELILAPPFEAHFHNNMINTHANELANHACTSPQSAKNDLVRQSITQSTHNGQQTQYIQQHPGYSNGNTDVTVGNNHKHVLQDQTNMADQQISSQSTLQAYMPSSDLARPPVSYDNEKLVSNGVGKTLVNSNKLKGRNLIKSESNGNPSDDNLTRQQIDSRYSLDQESPGIHHMNSYIDFDVSRQRVTDHHDAVGKGYSNEMYHNTHELNHLQPSNMLINDSDVHSKTINHESIKNIPIHNVATNGRPNLPLNTNPINNIRNSCSPSTSVGSTVRLADECDSGASSYLSNNAKNGTPSSPYPYKPTEQAFNKNIDVSYADREKVPINADQDVVDDLPSDMERIKVTLEKDEKDGLGITVAGYTFEREEISGIFIKSILPNSPAERSGRIRALDQIFSVNGRALLGYSNTDAVRELKQTPKSVTLELVRYPDGSKYQKLQAKLAKVQRESNNQNLPSQHRIATQQDNGLQQPTNVESTTMKSSIPVSSRRESSPLAEKLASPIKPSSDQCSKVQTYYEDSKSESIYKNDITAEQRTCPTSPIQAAKNRFTNNESANLSPRQEVVSQIPVAAQRTGTNKIIETKQGARNTIDIRSPVCQNAVTYANKVAEIYCGETVQNRIATLFSQNSDSNDSYPIRINELEWEKDAKIIEIYKDSSKGLGFKINDYKNPKDPERTIIMITSVTPGGIAERDGRLGRGDLLIFVDDTNLQGASMDEAVKALKKTNGQVTLGILKKKLEV